MKRNTWIEIICYTFFLLFTYTALSKLFIYPTYVTDLQRSPELQPFAYILSVVIPISELIVSGLLIFGKTRRIGLWGSLMLMLLFTVYVGGVLLFSKTLPCSCGGIIRNLTWRAHTVFNIGFTLLALLGITLERKYSAVSWP